MRRPPKKHPISWSVPKNSEQQPRTSNAPLISASITTVFYTLRMLQLCAANPLCKRRQTQSPTRNCQQQNGPVGVSSFLIIRSSAAVVFQRLEGKESAADSVPPSR
jgi:hypothetical protein